MFDIEQWLDTTLTEGIKEETFTEDFKSKCEHCGKLFDTKRKIKVHTNRVHNPQNTCDLCGRTFS